LATYIVPSDTHSGKTAVCESSRNAEVFTLVE
jgi:hypothetical protein